LHFGLLRALSPTAVISITQLHGHAHIIDWPELDSGPYD
jgi:hypothetical protein